MFKHLQAFYYFLLISAFLSCAEKTDDPRQLEKKQAIESILIPDSSLSFAALSAVENRIRIIQDALQQKIPILLLPSNNPALSKVQAIAIKNAEFCEDLLDPKTKQAFRNEIFNVYQARPQEIPAGRQQGNVYKVEMYNYALNLSTTALVDLQAEQVLMVNKLPASQPDIPTHLKDLALKIAAHHPEVIKALGYQPNEAEALMSNTKTALNNTKCERSMHLCVAPTFIKEDKALWVIVDLTDHKVVGIRWTQTGKSGAVKRVSERKLKFDKIMECYCKQVNQIEKQQWKLNYIITTSDGLRISEVHYKNKLVIQNAKVVDWHVSYSNTEGFGYSDAVGCPEFSQAAVVAVSEPRVSEIKENGDIIGFALEQNFSSEQWPLPCNYNYLQRFEFYKDGRFRPICASLGRGCGNNGTYRPVTRIDFAGQQHTFSEWNGNQWQNWTTEKWNLQSSLSVFTPEKYQYKISVDNDGGYYIEPGLGQFKDGGRGDHSYVYVTKHHNNLDEGDNDLVSIGPCCNNDFRQGPEKFMSPAEDIQSGHIILWYVAQLKNDDTPGHKYCWSESDLEDGVYKTKVFPCLSGPMFIPIK